MVWRLAYIYTVVVLAVLFIASPASALEMSSKRNCAICHVMWLDDFRTDKETLIEWQPGNVLMKDTQGVVSSEEMCYSCHDGYVMDSRYVTWKYNGHRTFLKPSKKVTVPADLPLSNKDEIYCGTCHTAHGGGSNTDASISGPLSFLRKDNIDSRLCGMCHRREAAFKQNNGHPTKTASYTIPEILFAAGSKRSKSRDQVICQTCHEVHGAKGNKLTVIENKNSELCTACHEKQESLIQSKHDLRVSLPGERNIKEQKPSESGPCGACHTPHNGADKRLWARGLKSGNPASPQCLACHGEKTGHKTTPIGKHSHPISVKSTSTGTAPKELPLFSANANRDSTGTVQCVTCHNAHRWDPDSLTNRGGINVEGDASNSFLRISNSSSSTLCLECHIDKKQLITSDHNLVVTAPEEKNIQGSTATVSGPCGACHIPHNASAEHLWAREPSEAKDFVSQLCTGCHNQDGAAKTKLIGDNYHPVDVAFKELHFTASLGPDAEMLPQYDSNGNRVPEGKIVCITCHEPHSWEPNNSKPLLNYEFKNLEGNTTNSFLRKANFPSSNLCETCHADKALVDGTDHDLSVTAPKATNLLGQTVKESGQCGACHLVHNSPNELKLWARSYGPISDQASLMNGLCRSCHSKGSNAEAKIPGIAIHPKGKLVNNVLQVDKEGANWAPVYSKAGKKTNVGYISCPTCHNGHRWSAFHKEKGIYKNLEGDARTSFLRNLSYNNLCRDCHAEDALFRYKYFHDPKIRKRFSSPAKSIPLKGFKP
jgi:predicted CXXCH cytochrome family protein